MIIWLTHVNISEFMSGLPPCCCAHLAGISGGVNFYLGSSIIIKNYCTLSTAIGGRDGMDGSRANWMVSFLGNIPNMANFDGFG